jgi:hypothetical protein
VSWTARMLPAMGEGGADEHGQFERDLSKLPSVTHARVVVDKGRVSEIHVVSDGLKDVRQLKRDIETVAKAAHDIDLDHRVISISAMPDVDVRPTSNRFDLVSIGLTTTGGIAECKVVVRRAGDVGEGSARGAATSTGMPKLAARATIEAVGAALGYALPVEIGNALFVPVGELRVATVVVVLLEDSGQEIVVGGTHPVRGDQNEAVARAAVDAVNRHFCM